MVFDSKFDISQDELVVSYHAGAEYILSRVIPIRIGYMNEQRLFATGEIGRENFISGGFGYFSQTGSVDISFNHSIERARMWTVVGSFQFYL